MVLYRADTSISHRGCQYRFLDTVIKNQSWGNKTQKKSELRQKEATHFFSFFFLEITTQLTKCALIIRTQTPLHKATDTCFCRVRNVFGLCLFQKVQIHSIHKSDEEPFIFNRAMCSFHILNEY